MTTAVVSSAVVPSTAAVLPTQHRGRDRGSGIADDAASSLNICRPCKVWHLSTTGGTPVLLVRLRVALFVRFTILVAMKDRRDPTGPTEARAAALLDAASRCETSAAAMWRLARDCDRWGLGLDSADARRLAISERVQAIALRAEAGSLGRGRNQTGERSI